MIYIIYPSDSSTLFLQGIISPLRKNMSCENLKVIRIEASDESYQDAITEIALIPNSSFVLFMGHGTGTEIYGGESRDFSKKCLFKKNDMGIFKNKDLLLLSCYSSTLLQSSRTIRNYSNSIGFGALPSGMEEVNASSKLRKQNLDSLMIDDYKKVIVECVFQSILLSFNEEYSFEQLYHYLKLTINRKISRLVIDEEKRTLADLLFQLQLDIRFE